MATRHRAQAALAVLLLAVACHQKAQGRKAEVSATAEATVRPEVVKGWLDLGIPRANLQRVLPESDEHGFYADYAGQDGPALLAEVSSGLKSAGYSQSCTAFEGMVVGFSNGRRQLAVKVDLGARVLSVFDAEGKEPLLHGVCFGRYDVGESHTLSQEEKEALARRLDEGEDVSREGRTPVSPRPR